MATKDEKVVHDDLEAGIDKSPKSNAVAVLEASALLTLWSILVINEGAIRFIESNPSNLDRALGPTDVSPYLTFFGGLAEVIFGIFGLFVGYSAFILRSYSTLITKLCMLTQTILGWFVFIVFVFVVPSVRASNLQQPILTLSTSTSRFIITMGIFTSFHFCLALQGGQFVFMARLVCAATGEDFLKQNSGHFMRACFWNANLALSGLWTLITGAVINAQVGSGELALPYKSPPNVGTLPGLTVTTGLIMFVWGIVGIIAAISKTASPLYYAGTGIVYLLALMNYGIAQFGTFAAGETGGSIALHNGLVFMVVFLGPYFVIKSAKENEDKM